jgi:hypothetical protein
MRAAVIKSAGSVSVETVDVPRPVRRGLRASSLHAAGDAWTRIRRSLALSSNWH